LPRSLSIASVLLVVACTNNSNSANPDSRHVIDAGSTEAKTRDLVSDVAVPTRDGTLEGASSDTWDALRFSDLPQNQDQQTDLHPATDSIAADFSVDMPSDSCTTPPNWPVLSVPSLDRMAVAAAQDVIGVFVSDSSLPISGNVHFLRFKRDGSIAAADVLLPNNPLHHARSVALAASPNSFVGAWALDGMLGPDSIRYMIATPNGPPTSFDAEYNSVSNSLPGLAVAALPSNQIAIAWTDGGSNNAIVLKVTVRDNTGGVVWGNNVVTTPSGTAYVPKMIYNDGKLTILFVANSNGNTSIFHTAFDATTGVGSAAKPLFTTLDGTGDFSFVWRDTNFALAYVKYLPAPSNKEWSNVYFATFDETGGMLSPEVQVTTHTYGTVPDISLAWNGSDHYLA
jgi:hypothetical protein